jgi:hypothetical protein
MTNKAILFIGTLCWMTAAAHAQTITVTSPGGGASWVQGSAHAIQWTSAGLPAGQTVSIILRLNGDRVGDIALNVPAAQGQYQWTVGTYLAGQVATGTGYQIRVRTPDLPADSTPFAISPSQSLPKGPRDSLVSAGTLDGLSSLIEGNLERMPESEVLGMLPDLVVCTSNTTRVHPGGTLVAKVKNRGVKSGAGILHFNIQNSPWPVIAVPALNPNQVFTATRGLGNKLLVSPTGNHYTLTVEMTQAAHGDFFSSGLREAYPENNTKTGIFYVTSDPIAPTPGFVCADGTTIQ